MPWSEGRLYATNKNDARIFLPLTQGVQTVDGRQYAVCRKVKILPRDPVFDCLRMEVTDEIVSWNVGIFTKKINAVHNCVRFQCWNGIGCNKDINKEFLMNKYFLD